MARFSLPEIYATATPKHITLHNEFLNMPSLYSHELREVKPNDNIHASVPWARYAGMRWDRNTGKVHGNTYQLEKQFALRRFGAIVDRSIMLDEKYGLTYGAVGHGQPFGQLPSVNYVDDPVWRSAMEHLAKRAYEDFVRKHPVYAR